jgi:hypothetical protein
MQSRDLSSLYTLDAVGNRLKVQEAAGRMIEYT